MLDLMPRDFEDQDEYEERCAEVEKKRHMITSLKINNIKVKDVGLVIEAIRELGLDVEMNI